ncbi:hypothetical protein AKO1_012592 [Acrasis kona]|uniref:Xenotropic and polytropic retrovirus receptor 1 n=1 Tax=Acrasis kona TaxID=1008807 RepID=A0AAW2YUV3_9EUKA
MKRLGIETDDDTKLITQDPIQTTTNNTHKETDVNRTSLPPPTINVTRSSPEISFDNVRVIEEINLEEESSKPKHHLSHLTDSPTISESMNAETPELNRSPFSSNYSLALSYIHNNRFYTQQVEQLITYVPEECKFFLNCFQHEIDKVNKFYSQKESEYHTRHVKLEQQIEALKKHNTTTSKNISNKIRQLQTAFQEHYRSLVLLENFRKLNYLASTKILKKFAKYSGNAGTNELILQLVRGEVFFNSVILKHMMEATETIFTQYVSNGNRKDAMHMLRVPTSTSNATGHDNAILFRCGVWIGCSTSLTLLSVYLYLYQYLNIADAQDDSELTFFLFRLMAFPVILSVLISMNIKIWSEANINYVFIFEMNPRRHLTVWQFAEITLVAYLLWILFFVFYLYSSVMDSMHVFNVPNPWMIPIVLFCIYTGFLLLPAPFLYGSARWWLIKIMLKVLAAPFVPVKFADFWFADQLTSMSDFLYDMQFVFCIYPTTFVPELASICDLSYQLGLPLLNMVPVISRLLQCLRRYYDSGDMNQMLNAGKYCSTMLAIIASYVHKKINSSDMGTAWMLIWFSVSIWSTLYKYVWDVVMDWGLFRVTDTKYKLLRRNLLYSPIWYYLAMIENLFIRTVWLWLFFLRFYFTSRIWDSQFVMFGIAIAELFRRFVWNVFRLENEHLNNADKFRAVVEVPLPFEVDQEANDAEDREWRIQAWNMFKQRLGAMVNVTMGLFKANQTLQDVENDQDLYGHYQVDKSVDTRRHDSDESDDETLPPTPHPEKKGDGGKVLMRRSSSLGQIAA